MLVRPYRLAMYLVLLAASACSGGSGPVSSSVREPTHSAEYVITSGESTYLLPPLANYSGTITLPAAPVSAGALMSLTTSIQSPISTAGDDRDPDAASGTLAFDLFESLKVSRDITFPSLPQFSITLPPGKSTAGLQFFYAISDPDASGGLLSNFQTDGPAAVSGETLTFASVAKQLVLLANHRYIFAIYSQSTPPSPTPSPKPTAKPTAVPTSKPSTAPTATPSPKPTASPLPVVVDVATPPEGANRITTGPDAELWFTEDNEIGRLTTAGALASFPIPDAATASPNYITSGPDGALWFTELSGSNIGRVTLGGAVTEYPLPSGCQKSAAIAPGPDGALWFAEQACNEIGRITTAGTVTEYPIPTASSGPVGITAGPDGAMWFTELTGNQIGRISVTGTVTEYPIGPAPVSVNGNAPVGQKAPNAIVAGTDGALWFSESSDTKVGRITTAGKFTETALPNAQSSLDIVSAADGALWLVQPNSFARVTTAGAISIYPMLSIHYSNEGLAVGPDRALYFTEIVRNTGGQRTEIGRISDPYAP